MDVHVQVGDLKEIGGRRGRTPPAQGLDPGDQFLHRERLCHVVVGPGVEALDPVLHLAAGGQDEDARRAVAIPKAGQDRKAVEAGQAQVENDEVRRVLDRGLERLRPVEEGRCRVAAPVQRQGDVPGQLAFVLDDMDSHAGSPRNGIVARPQARVRGRAAPAGSIPACTRGSRTH